MNVHVQYLNCMNGDYNSTSMDSGRRGRKINLETCVVKSVSVTLLSVHPCLLQMLDKYSTNIQNAQEDFANKGFIFTVGNN